MRKKDLKLDNKKLNKSFHQMMQDLRALAADKLRRHEPMFESSIYDHPVHSLISRQLQEFDKQLAVDRLIATSKAKRQKRRK